MLTDYIRAALQHARYEIMPDSGTYYGNIPGFQGVWANAPTLEVCRAELQEVLEDWILLARIVREARISRDEWEAI